MYNLLGGFGRMNMGEWASKDSISWRTASSISWRLQQTRHGCAGGSCPPRNRHRGRVERGPVDVRPGPHEPQRRAGLGESQLPVAPAERGPGAGGGLLAAAGRRPHATSLLHGSDVSKRTVSPCSPVHPRPERRGFLGGLDKLLAVMVEGIGTQMHSEKPRGGWASMYCSSGMPGGWPDYLVATVRPGANRLYFGEGAPLYAAGLGPVFAVPPAHLLAAGGGRATVGSRQARPAPDVRPDPRPRPDHRGPTPPRHPPCEPVRMRGLCQAPWGRSRGRPGMLVAQPRPGARVLSNHRACCCVVYVCCW